MLPHQVYVQEIDLAQQRIICEESVRVWGRILGEEFSLDAHLDGQFGFFVEEEFPVRCSAGLKLLHGLLAQRQSLQSQPPLTSVARLLCAQTTWPAGLAWPMQGRQAGYALA